MKTCHTCGYADWTSGGLDAYWGKRYRLGHCKLPLPLYVKGNTIYSYKVGGRWCSQGNGCQIECATHKTPQELKAVAHAYKLADTLHGKLKRHEPMTGPEFGTYITEAAKALLVALKG